MIFYSNYELIFTMSLIRLTSVNRMLFIYHFIFHICVCVRVCAQADVNNKMLVKY